MYWGFCFDFAFPSLSCKVRNGQILFAASPSWVCFPKVSESGSSGTVYVVQLGGKTAATD